MDGATKCEIIGTGRSKTIKADLFLSRKALTMVEITQADPDAAASVILTREVFDFLMGAGPLEGVEFGELHEGLPGRFWWRAVLRAAERETPAHRLAAIAEGRRQMREEAAKLLEDANAKWQERVAVYRKAGNNGPYLGYGSVSADEIRAIPIGDE